MLLPEVISDPCRFFSIILSCAMVADARYWENARMTTKIPKYRVSKQVLDGNLISKIIV